MKSIVRLAAVLVLVLAAWTAPASALDGGTALRTYLGGYGHDLVETADGGALLAVTWGAGFDCCRPSLVKLGPDGSVQWHKTYDAPGMAGVNNLVPTRDGNYVLSIEGTEFQVLKVDADGNLLWARNYGDGGYTHLRAVEADDGSILLTGATELGDGAATNGRAVLIGPDGELLWQTVMGRPFVPDYFTGAIQGYNGNFVLVGSLRGDYWVAELERTTGAVVWQNVYGGPAEDTALAVAPVLRRHYAVVGASDSFTEGGFRNVWVAILQDNGKLWRQMSIGGRDAEDPHAVLPTSDGGFLVGAGTGSFGAGFADLWLVKFDSRTRVEWQTAYGRADRTDSAWSLTETATGYTVIGDSYLFPTDYDFWLMSVGPDGSVDDATCGVVTPTDAIARRTHATVDPAGALQWNDAPKITAPRVTVTSLDVPLAACAPAE